MHELHVLTLVAEGKTNKKVAAALNRSEKTVKNSLANIYDKLNTSRRAQTAPFMREAWAPSVMIRTKASMAPALRHRQTSMPSPFRRAPRWSEAPGPFSCSVSACDGLAVVPVNDGITKAN